MKLTYLDLSTSHLTPQTMERLSFIGSDLAHIPDGRTLRLADAGWPAMTIAAYPNGLFITVPSDAEPEQWDAMPSDLLFVMDMARKAGATLVRFDSDGDVVDGLPVHDWESQEEIGKRLVKQVIGKTVSDAKAWCVHAGFKFRCRSIDNMPCLITQDIRQDRIEARVVRNRVIEANVG